VLYNVGNLAFLTPGKFYTKKPTGRKDMNGDKLLPYGMAVHLLVDKSGRLCALELQCNYIDNKSNKYPPRLCTQVEDSRRLVREESHRCVRTSREQKPDRWGFVSSTERSA
jgi:hypothetical protein